MHIYLFQMTTEVSIKRTTDWSEKPCPLLVIYTHVGVVHNFDINAIQMMTSGNVRMGQSQRFFVSAFQMLQTLTLIRYSYTCSESFEKISTFQKQFLVSVGCRLCELGQLQID